MWEKLFNSGYFRVLLNQIMDISETNLRKDTMGNIIVVNSISRAVIGYVNTLILIMTLSSQNTTRRRCFETQ